MPDANATVPENLESRKSIVPPASRCFTLSDGLKRWQTFRPSGMLTLFIASLHSNTTVRPRGIDPTPIVFAKELATVPTIEEHRHAVLGDLLHHLIHALAGMVTISVDQPRLTEHVDLVAFDEKMPFAAGSALIAFVLCHCQIVARCTFGASRILAQWRQRTESKQPPCFGWLHDRR